MSGLLLTPLTMNGPNLEQLCRNGQLVWDKVPEHRVTLERYYNFFKGTADEEMIAANYPEFYKLMKEQEAPEKKAPEPREEQPKEDQPKQEAKEGEPKEEPENKPKKKTSKKSSPKSDAK